MKSSKPKTFLPKKTGLLIETKFTIAVIGIGGTGSHVVPELAAMITSNEKMREQVERIILIDDDTVESKNVGRQRYIEADIGYKKADVHAKRYSRAYPIPIVSVTKRLTERNIGSILPHPSFRKGLIIISTVDNRLARKVLFDWLRATGGKRKSGWWIDAGNDTTSGWVNLGTTSSKHLIKEESKKAFSKQPFIEYLPYSPIVFPDLLDDELIEKEEAERLERLASCAEEVESGNQSVRVNAAMANIIVTMFHNLLKSQLTTSFVIMKDNGLTVKNQPITNNWLKSLVGTTGE